MKATEWEGDTLVRRRMTLRELYESAVMVGTGSLIQLIDRIYGRAWPSRETKKELRRWNR